MSSYDDKSLEEWQCWCNFTNSIRRSKCYLCGSPRKKPNASSKKRSGKDKPDTTDNNGDTKKRKVMGKVNNTPKVHKGGKKLPSATVTDLKESVDVDKSATPKTQGNTRRTHNNKEVSAISMATAPNGTASSAASLATAIKPYPKKHVAKSAAANATVASKKATRSNVGNDKAEKPASKKEKSGEGSRKAEKAASKKSGGGGRKAEKTTSLKLLHKMKSNSEDGPKMIPLSEEQIDHWKKLFYNIHETIIKGAKGKPPEQRYEFISSSLRSNSFTDYTWGDEIIRLYQSNSSELQLKDDELKMLRLKSFNVSD